MGKAQISEAFEYFGDLSYLLLKWFIHFVTPAKAKYDTRRNIYGQNKNLYDFV